MLSSTAGTVGKAKIQKRQRDNRKTIWFVRRASTGIL